jgi:hypothetical protein
MPVNCLGGPPFEQRPSNFAFSCDGGRVFTRVRWSTWGRATAAASGVAGIQGPCTPSCSLAAEYRYHVKIVASQIALCGRRRVYGLITAYFNGRDIDGDRSLTHKLGSCVRS